MIQRYVLVLVVLCGFSPDINTALRAQVGTIEGTVLDSASGEPLVGAAVFIEAARGRQGTLTRRGGVFRLDNVGAGEVVVTARLLGYRELRREMAVRTGETTRARILLPGSAVSMRPLEVIGESPEVHRQMTGTATRVDTRQLEAIAPIGTQEVMQTIPGINTASDDGIGNSRISVGIRGLNPRRSSRVLVLEDGVPIAPAVYLYPNMYYNPPAERIDVVEVIKGSAAIRYGPQTMGGVINYITRRPRSQFGALALVTAGTNGYLTALAEVGGWGNDVFHPEIQVLAKRGDGFRDNNAFEQLNATAKLTIVPDEDDVIYVKANFDRERSDATYTGLTEYSFATDPTFNPKEHDEFDVVRASLDVLYSQQLTPSASSTTKLYANYFDRQWWRENDVFVRPGGSASGEVTAVPWYESGDLVRVGNGRDNYGNLRTFAVAGVEQSYVLNDLVVSGSSLEIGGRLHWDRFLDDRVIGDAPDARTGIYYRVDPNDSANVEILGLSNHYETMALALFASNRFTLGSLTITPGIRFELFEQEMIDRLAGSTYQDRTSSVLLPGVGVNLDLDGINLFGGIHRGYTPPSSGTLAVVNWGSDYRNGGLDVESEKSWNLELGMRGSLGWSQFELAGFHMTIDGLVAAGVGTNFENLGRARTYGLELATKVFGAAIAEPLPDLTIAYTLLQSEVLEGSMKSAIKAGSVLVDLAGKELPYAPRHTLTAGIGSEVADGVQLHADVQYVSRVFTDFENIERTGNRGDTGPVPEYWVMNASASYALTPSITISVAGKNLFDRIYIGSRLHSNPGMPEANQSSGILPGPRRQVNLTLRYAI